MVTVRCVHTWHGNRCVYPWHGHLTFVLEIITFNFEICPVKSCMDQYLEIIHDNCFIFSGQINVTYNLCTFRLFWPFALKIWPSLWTFCPGHCLQTINDNCFILSGPINLTWDLHTIISTVVLEIMTFGFEILFVNSCSAQSRDIQCQRYIYIYFYFIKFVDFFMLTCTRPQHIDEEKETIST